MLKQSLMVLSNSLNNAKKNRDPKDTLKVKLSEKDANDIMRYLKDLEEIKKKIDTVK